MPVAQRGHVFVRLADDRQRLLAAVSLEVMAGIRDHAYIEPDFIMQPEHILDRRRTLPAPERRRLLARRVHMRMPINDHGFCFAACVRSAASSISVPHPGPVGSTMSPFSTRNGLVRSFCFQGT